MRVLVTGATGFIGGAVVARLLAGGHAVRALVRPSSDASGLPAGVEVARGDLGDAARACDGVDGVVHLAGIGGPSATAAELARVNVDGTRAVFDGARRAGVRRAVHVTSVWTMLRPDLAATSAYLRSRLESERVALAAPAISTAICCPTFVVGAGDRGPNFPGQVIQLLAARRLPVLPSGGMTWIAVDDAARAIVAALERGEPGARYALGAEFLTYAEVADEVARVVGARPVRRAVPLGVLRTSAAVVDRVLAAVGRTPPVPMRDGLAMLTVDAPIDCAPTWRALGPPEVAVRDAIAEALAWWRVTSAARSAAPARGTATDRAPAPRW